MATKSKIEILLYLSLRNKRFNHLTNWLFSDFFFLRFTKDIEEMTGYRPGAYWQFTWRFLAPIIMVCILVSSIISMVVKKPQYSAWDASRVSSGKYYLVTHISRCQNTYVTTSTFLSFFLSFFFPFLCFQGIAVPTAYPSWVLAIAVVIIFAGIAPIPIVFLLRRFQCVKLDVDIHQGSIRRIDTTVSTKEMMGDVDVSRLKTKKKKKKKKKEKTFTHNFRSSLFVAIVVFAIYPSTTQLCTRAFASMCFFLFTFL